LRPVVRFFSLADFLAGAVAFLRGQSGPQGRVQREKQGIMTGMEHEIVHLSQAEAIRDIATILERVERGAEVIVEKDQRPAVVMRPAPRPGRLLSECIALAESRGSTTTLDEGFSKDLEEIISRREPLDVSQWD
jgi:antitoxin (DNA-binding transcriptional repressor) of toxin-antitoxin stability system